MLNTQVCAFVSRAHLPAGLLLSLGALACNPPNSTDSGNDDETEQPVCGDGQLDPLETCDDGNTNAGDGCSPTCQLAGTPSECVTLMRGNGAPDDRVDVVLPLADSFVAAGSLNTDGTAVAWVGHWGEQGEEHWLTTISTADTDTRLRDLTTDGSTGYWAALDAAGVAELAHIDESGNLLERRTLADTKLRRVRWVAGRLWAAGSSHGDLWLGALAGDTVETLLWEDHLGFDDTIGAMHVDGDRVLVAATLATSPSVVDDIMQTPTSEIAVITFDLDGNELSRDTLEIDSLDTLQAIGVLGTTGGWVAAGLAPPVEAVLQRPQAWIASPNDNWQWSSLSIFGPQTGSAPQGGASVGGIVSLDGATLFAGGSYTNTGANAALVATGWIQEFDRAGQLIWDNQISMPEEAYYRETGIAIDPRGRIRTVGVGWTDMTSSTLRSCIVER